ncbi:hypothetical protein NPIL_55501 [Nephila pilipes]|uniref:Uncharacterized protein n=1 Tax=Nephila pilipes TaxID=299642 RepID=A0A8X6T6N0_NEPPI|nr:hypothetical protein NPIL_55501 [Nephila pilipes]
MSNRKINPHIPQFGVNDISIKERMTQLSLFVEGRPPALRPGMVGATRSLTTPLASRSFAESSRGGRLPCLVARKVEAFFA